MSKKKNQNRKRRNNKQKVDPETGLTKKEYEAYLAREEENRQTLEYLESVGVPIDWENEEPIGIWDD